MGALSLARNAGSERQYTNVRYALGRPVFGKLGKIACGTMLGKAASGSMTNVSFFNPKKSCPFLARHSTIEMPRVAGARGCIMSTTKVALLLHQIRRMATEPTSPDGVSLERFTNHADEAAFNALMRRHGPLVWSVSLRGTRHEQDAEDVYQATFLLLARKASSIRKTGSVSSWLYGVAHRLALRARSHAARHREREHHAVPVRESSGSDDLTVRELREVLDDELAKLPDKYRAPLLLCYFEGMTHEEASRQLGWTPRSVKDRLERGRNRLRVRLAKRGVTLSLTLAGSMLTGGLATATAPPALVVTTLRAAVIFAARRPLDGIVRAGALGLAAGGLRTMLLAKLYSLVFVPATVLILGGAGLLIHSATSETLVPVATEPPDDSERMVDRYGDPLPPGAVVRLGTVRYRYNSHGSHFLPDGKTVVSVVEQDRMVIKLWNARTGRLIREFDTGLISHPQMGTALSRDGKRFAVSGQLHDNAKQEWRGAAAVFDLDSGKAIRLIECDAVIWLTMSQDGKTLFTLDGSGNVLVNDVATGKELIRQQFKPGRLLPGIELSPDGSTILLADRSVPSSFFLWKWQRAEKPREVPVPKRRVAKMTFSPDGKHLAASCEDDPGVLLLDADDGKLLRKLELPDFEPYRHFSVAFAPNGKLLAAWAATNEETCVHLWDPATGKFLQRLPISGAPAFSPDSTLLLAGSRIWDLAASKELSANNEAHLREVDHIVTGGKDVVVTATWDRTIRVWDATSGKHRLSIAHSGRIRDMALSPDGKKLVTSTLLGDNSVSIWDVATGKRIYRLCGHGRLGGRGAVVFTPDGNAVLSWGDDMQLRKWDTRTGKAVSELRIRPTGIEVPDDEDADNVIEILDGKHDIGPASFTQDAKHFVLKADGGFFVFDATTGKELRWFSSDADRHYNLTLSPDGKYALASTRDKARQIKLPDGSVRWVSPTEHYVRYWDLAKGELRTPVLIPEEDPGAVAFNPDGQLFAVASSMPGAKIRLFETSTGREVRKIEGFKGTVRSLAFMPDGKRLVSGMSDSSALIWDLTRER
jgi:RNA polymerase sigma factor (sigma-70 family)